MVFSQSGLRTPDALSVDEKRKLVIILSEMKARGIPIPENLEIPKGVDALSWRVDEKGYFIKKDGKKFKPRPVLEEFINDPSRFILLKSGRGGGKALPLDTEIPTPNGWKTLADVREGDYVFSDLGKPVKVLWESDVMVGNDCFEISLFGGEKVIADAGHIWTVYKSRSSKPINMTTEQLAQSNLVYGNSYVYKIKNCEPVDYDKRSLPISPYLLGVWLGDGNKREARITIHDGDLQIVDIIRELGYPIHRVSDLYGWSMSGEAKVLNGLRSIGVINSKHIPDIYLQSSVEDRLELLCGLMDTDGTISVRGHCSFDNKNKALVDGVYELISSLGIKASVHQYKSYLGETQYADTYKISFTPTIPVFRLERKLKRQRLLNTRSSINFRHITGIRPVESVPVKCIKVDSQNSLFLINRFFLPTHNSTAGVQKALKKIKEGQSGAVMNPDF